MGGGSVKFLFIALLRPFKTYKRTFLAMIQYQNEYTRRILEGKPPRRTKYEKNQDWLVHQKKERLKLSLWSRVADELGIEEKGIFPFLEFMLKMKSESMTAPGSSIANHIKQTLQPLEANERAKRIHHLTHTFRACRSMIDLSIYQNKGKNLAGIEHKKHPAA